MSCGSGTEPPWDVDSQQLADVQCRQHQRRSLTSAGYVHHLQAGCNAPWAQFPVLYVCILPQGEWALNERLLKAVRLFEGQIHGSGGCHHRKVFMAAEGHGCWHLLRGLCFSSRHSMQRVVLAAILGSWDTVIQASKQASKQQAGSARL
jgi:hypothetical protein